MQNVVRNSFFSPGVHSKGVDYSNDLVEVFELQDVVVEGPNFENDKSDFVVDKRPVKVDSYHHSKVIAERCKGQDLKSIIAKLQRSGDLSLIQQKEVVYGDSTTIPHSLSEALEKKVQTESFLDKLSDDQKKELVSLSKMSKEELDTYIQARVDEIVKKGKTTEDSPVEGEK